MRPGSGCRPADRAAAGRCSVIRLMRYSRSSRNSPRPTMLGEVPVGGRDDPDVHGPLLARAEHLEGPVLQHAQHLDLRRRIEVANLVEEDRSAVGHLEAALPILPGVGERASHVAEHLALEQRRRDAAEVHLHERRGRGAGCCGGWRRRPAPCRCRSRPVMSTEASVGATRPTTCSTLQQPGVLADEVAEVERGVELLARGRLPRRRRRGRKAERGAHGLQDLLVGPRLGDEVEAPAFMPRTASSIDPHAVISTTGRVGCAARMLREQLQPSSPVVRRREVHVLQDQLASMRREPRQRVGRRRHRVTTRSRPASAAAPATRSRTGRRRR